MLGDAVFIKNIKIKNLLSFGSEGVDLQLGSLNVLIGPNSSGKSNFIEVINLLKSTTSDIQQPIRDGGGISEWICKQTEENTNKNIYASVEVIVDYPKGPDPLEYTIVFFEINQQFLLLIERIFNSEIDYLPEQEFIITPFYNLDKTKGQGNFWTKEFTNDGKEKERRLTNTNPSDFNTNNSIFSQIRSPNSYPEMAYVGDLFKNIKLFRDWNYGSGALIKKPNNPNTQTEFLNEDVSNLAVVYDYLVQLNKDSIIFNTMKKFYEGLERITVNNVGGALQIFFHEKGLSSATPAIRLSDGTLKFLSLLVILNQPNPPEIICIEEPELGLHPDVIPMLADLFIEASKKSQLFITTHSDILVSALSHVPESVIVCERDDRGTSMRRLEKKKLIELLKDNPLGELWMEGEIGGNRW